MESGRIFLLQREGKEELYGKLPVRKVACGIRKIIPQARMGRQSAPSVSVSACERNPQSSGSSASSLCVVACPCLSPELTQALSQQRAFIAKDLSPC